MNDAIRGTLAPTEHHPAADDAMRWVRSLNMADLFRWREAFASCAIEGNRLAEVCGETVDRLIRGEPVSDRYLLGLAWTLRYEPPRTEHPEKRSSTLET